MFYKKNNADPDWTPHFAVSDLGLQCLPTSYGTLGINGLKISNLKISITSNLCAKHINGPIQVSSIKKLI